MSSKSRVNIGVVIASKPEYFPWTETGARLLELAKGVGLRPAPDGRAFVGRDEEHAMDVRVSPPLVLPIPGAASVDEYVSGLPAGLGPHLVFLMQAGSCALGVWNDDDLLAHKVIKKYVVRGKGRAQPIHLKTKGKSRYGSRLRLRNARALLAESNQRMIDWSEEHGPFEHVYYSCPVRLLAELLAARPGPPFGKEDLVKVPLDVKVPNHAELLRVHRAVTHGKIVYTAHAADSQ